MQVLNLKARGLFISPNPLSAMPQGAMSVADNVVIDYDNLVASRRGINFYGSAVSGGISALFNYNSSLILSYASKLAYDSNDAGTWVDYSGTYADPDADYRMRSLESNKNFYFTTSGGVKKLDALTSAPVASGAPRALDGTGATTGATGFLSNNDQVAYRLLWGYRDANSNLIIGVPSARTIIVNTSGGTRNVALSYVIPSGVTTSWFYQLYRSAESGGVSIEPDDELQLVDEGQPTAAMITAKTLTVTDSRPSDLRGVTLYTSPSQEGVENANFQPPYAKDMALFKGSVFYGNVKDKHTFDLSLLGTGLPNLGYDTQAGDLHTNKLVDNLTDTSDFHIGMRVSGTGIPVGTRIAAIVSATSITLTLAATATAAGVSLVFADIVRFGDYEIFAGATTNASISQFAAVTGGTPAENVERTAQNIVAVINGDAANTLYYAYYTSGFNDLPGSFQVEERGIGGSEFLVTSSAGTAFGPILPADEPALVSLANPTVITSYAHGLASGQEVYFRDATSTPTVNGYRTVTVTGTDTFTVPVNVTVAGAATWILASSIQRSDNDEQPHRVRISKTQQPEACPLYRYIDCGAANFPILRVIALRDSVFVLKGDGIFRITGEDFASFRASLFDNTVQLLANESAVTLTNQIYAFTDQGIVAIADTGVSIVSRPIESELLRLSSDLFTNFASVTFAVGYESDRKYILFTVTEEDDTYATQAFVYNVLTNSFTKWILSKCTGIVNKRNNKLYLGDPVNNFVYQERKDYASTDYADESYAVAIVSSSAFEVTLTSTTAVDAGMTLLQSGREAVVLSVDSATVITVSQELAWLAGAATVYTPIRNTAEWIEEDADNPGIIKHWQECTLLFRDARFRVLNVAFSTNFNPVPEEIEIVPVRSGGWGTFPWGALPWGSSSAGSQPIRTYVPRNSAMSHWIIISIELNQAFQSMGLEGISIPFNPGSTRFK